MLCKENGFSAVDIKVGHVIDEVNMKHMFFKPWKGNHFSTNGFLSKRVLILGESHYQWDEDVSLTEDLTIECILEQIEGGATKQFWTNIAITFLNKRPSLEDKEQFWHSVAFYNYVQANVGFGPRVRPTREMWANSQKAFFEVLQELRPQCVIVLGYQLWENLPSQGEKGPIIEAAEQQETWKYPIEDDNFTLAYAIKHPSAGFSGWTWHPFVMRAIELSR